MTMEENKNKPSLQKSQNLSSNGAVHKDMNQLPLSLDNHLRLRNSNINFSSGSSSSSTTSLAAKPFYEESFIKNFLLRTFAPIFLTLTCPNAVIVLWYTVAHCKGSFALMGQMFCNLGLYGGLIEVWKGISLQNPAVYLIFLLYIIFEVILMKVVPGQVVHGPVTLKGNQPTYIDNGFFCYLITLAVYLIVTASLYIFTPYSITIIFDHFDEILGTLSVLSICICLFLYLKGRFFPSTSDSGTSGNIFFDYFWGTELYPRIFGIDIKVLTNCRFGLTVWGLLVLTFALKNYELYGFVSGVWVSTFLQTVYILKFFWWESGYMNTIDIMMDRAGFYICWGCLVFVPGLYTSVSLYLATCSISLGNTASVLVTIVGLASCYINYWADKQKQEVRHTNGNCLIWGKKAEVILAKYEVEGGIKKENLLLVSGFWGISRHFHYLPELILALCWSLPCGFDYIMPYTYFLFLCFLLTHRTYRDDTKCHLKYTKYWDEYCRRVPYKILPYIF